MKKILASFALAGAAFMAVGATAAATAYPPAPQPPIEEGVQSPVPPVEEVGAGSPEVPAAPAPAAPVQALPAAGASGTEMMLRAGVLLLAGGGGVVLVSRRRSISATP